MFSETVLIAIIGSLNIVLGGIVAVVLAKVRGVETSVQNVASHVEQVKHNVVNDHTSNMREEFDSRHDENAGMLRSIRLSQVAGEQRQLEHGEALDSLLTLGVENRRRIIALERTERINEYDPETSQQDARRERRYRSAYSPPHPEGGSNGGYVYRSRRDFRRAHGDHT